MTGLQVLLGMTIFLMPHLRRNVVNTLIVDSNKFLELWRNDPRQSEKHLAFGNESVWRRDYKFHYAEKGFLDGIDNPVPLAYVLCYLTDFSRSFSDLVIHNLSTSKSSTNKIPYCAFTNGITRTIWLLANGAECFPVKTDENCYELLNFHAGILVSDELNHSLVRHTPGSVI